MEIITSHNALDFDGLASMVAAGKLYPAAVKVFSGTISKNVKQFLALYKDSLKIRTAKTINLAAVKRMIIVDTANANRLGTLSNIAANKQVELHIFDHHPTSFDDLQGTVNEIHPVGANTTILVEQIIAQGIYISAFEATILALGIYEDTGSLLFSSTTARDAAAVTFLLGMGANLSVIGRFIEQPFTSDQRQLLQELLNAARHYTIKNSEVVMAVSKSEAFVPGLDAVTFRLFEVENCDALFVVVEMEGKVNVVARSRTNKLSVNNILKKLNGRGHDKAASAVVKNKNPEEVVVDIIDALGETIDPGLAAQDIMSTPVKTVSSNITMEEAGRIMLRYGHTGLPVVDEGMMVGVISRRDVDKALIHKLEHAPVRGFMSTSVVWVESHTPVEEVQKILVEHDIGRVPVLSEGRIIGIVSRTDILRVLHGKDLPEDHALLYAMVDHKPMNVQDLMEERLPSKILFVLKAAGTLGDELGCGIYCVGGFVRDLMLKVPNFDIDLVVEGDGESFTRALANKLGGRQRVHHRFQTGVVILEDGMKIDVATSRTEYYEFPAALPKVERSALKEDLFRRDFTINTIAIALNAQNYGEIIDYFGGVRDLEKGCVRILYNLSFVEDPTRVLRAVRFEQRYGFTIESDTLRFAQDAIARRLLDKLSYKRILQELILILSEKDPVPSLERIAQIGAWEYILPEIRWKEVGHTTLKRIPLVIGWCEERYSFDNIQAWLVFILELTAQLSNEPLQSLIERYRFNRYVRKALWDARTVPEVVEKLNDPEVKPSDLHKRIEKWSPENIIFLLLAIKDEGSWERFSYYLEQKERVHVEINGYDLIEMGIKKGPLFGLILTELYQQKLDGVIRNRAEEMVLVQKWIKERYFDRSIDG